MGKDNDVKVAALLGTAQHAINQVKAGVDILVVLGQKEGTGQCLNNGFNSEVYQAIQPYGDVPILARVALLPESKWLVQWQWEHQVHGVVQFG